MKVPTVTIPSIKEPLQPSPGFAKKELSSHKLDLAQKCAFTCTYCSSNVGTNNRVRLATIAKATEEQLGERVLPNDGKPLMIAWPDVMANLRAQLAGKRPGFGRGKTLQFGMLVDNFSPGLVNTGVTLDALELVFEQTEFRIRILTKNCIVGKPRWIQLFAKYAGRIVVGLSIGTLDNEWARRIEGGTSLPTARLRALRALQDAGIPTFAMLCPIFPDVLEGDGLERLVDTVRPGLVEHVWAEPFNDRANWRRVRDGYAPGSAGHDRFTQMFASNGGWSAYATELYVRLRAHLRALGQKDKLRYLLYQHQIAATDARSFAGLEGVLLQSATDDPEEIGDASVLPSVAREPAPLIRVQDLVRGRPPANLAPDEPARSVNAHSQIAPESYVTCESPSTDATASDNWRPVVPFGSQDAPLFPTATLPQWLRGYVEALAVSNQVEPDMPAMLALAAIATASQGKFAVEVKAGYVEPLPIYVVVVAPSGDRKTATIAAIRKPIEAFERDEAQRLEGEISDGELKRRIVTKAIKAAESTAARSARPLDPAVLAPIRQLKKQLAELGLAHPPQLLAHDVTVEALAIMMTRNAGRAAILADEAAILDKILGRSKRDESCSLDLLLQAYSGSPFRVDRVSREPITIESPALTLGITVQPSVLRALGERDRLHDRGLLARMLFVLPRSRVGARWASSRSVPTSIMRGYAESLTHLLRLQASAPFHAPLSDEARACWQAFFARVEAQIGPDGELARLAPWADKLRGGVARIAGLLHVADEMPINAWLPPIPGATMERAVEIGTYLIAHARVAFDLSRLDPRIAAADRILEWIAAGRLKRFGARDAFQVVKNRLGDMRTFMPVLALLVEHEFIRLAAPPIPRTQGRPSQVYEVNPMIEAQNPQNPKPSTALDLFEIIEAQKAAEDDGSLFCAVT